MGTPPHRLTKPLLKHLTKIISDISKVRACLDAEEAGKLIKGFSLRSRR
jgi:hypothetical protein